MNITFKHLCYDDLALLLKRLEKPHVKDWWDQDIVWTPALIQEKFGCYIKGNKVEEGVAKKINAYIIYIGETPIGYIQIYDAYDFTRSKPLQDLPPKLAAFDIFIGEENLLKRGIGSAAMKLFFENHLDPSFNYIFADPDRENFAAIRAYEKVGFRRIKEQADSDSCYILFYRGTINPR